MEPKEEDDNEMETLGLVESPNTKVTNRRIDFLTGRQAVFILLVYLICNMVILILYTNGPSYIITKLMKFGVVKDDFNLGIRRFSFDFVGMSIFNDFLSLSIFFNEPLTVEKSINASFYFLMAMNKGTNFIRKVEKPAQNIIINGNDKSSFLKGIPIYTAEIINFDSLHSIITMNTKSNFTGSFQWAYTDLSYTIFDIFVRFAFLVSGIVCIIYLRNSFKGNDNISVKYMLYLDILFIIACNPFYLLNYATNSQHIKLVDTFLRFLFFIFCTFTAISLLLMKDLVRKEISFTWIFIRLIPFGIAFIIFTGTYGYDILMFSKDTQLSCNPIFYYIRFLLVFVYFVVLIFGIMTYVSETYEKIVCAFLALIFFSILAIVELDSLINHGEGRFYKAQLVYFLAAATYTLFYNFLNCPINSYMENAECIDEKESKEGLEMLVSNSDNDEKKNEENVESNHEKNEEQPKQ